jgi:hypothetical protein
MRDLERSGWSAKCVVWMLKEETRSEQRWEIGIEKLQSGQGVVK